MRRPHAWVLSCAVLACAGLAAACGGTQDADTGPDTDEAPARHATASASPDLRETCGSALPPHTPLAAATLHGSGGVELAAGVYGEGGSETVLVLLHQISSNLCGWGGFAGEAAAAGVTSVAIDLCGYGGSTCPRDVERDPAEQVRLAANHARAELGASRVVVVGASMGGSQAVRAVAGGAPVDAWVDVSGPSAWDGDRLLDLAEELEPPGLVVFTRTDGEREYAAARALADRSGARFLDGGRGHGWDLLTTFGGRLTGVGREVLEFATDGR